ncbi:MAG: protein translocase subunit SecD [Deferrisomatales bacterium]|nr:protein translocase subunit SecD [Deferrisomatales bacterium]
MNVSLKWRATLVAAFAVLGLLFLAPTLLGPEARLPGFLPQERLHLGLDLQGGMHLVLEVETRRALENSLERVAGELRESFREQRLRVRSVEARGAEIRVTARDGEAVEAVLDLLRREYPGLEVRGREEVEAAVTLRVTFTGEEAARIEEYAVAQGIETIRNRVDEFGVSEPAIVPQGDKRILIQLPGIRDPDRAIQLIGKTAQLEFRLLDETMTPDQALREGVPSGSELLNEQELDPLTRQVVRRVPHLVQKRVLMTGDVITDARVQIDPQFNEPYVTLQFDARGARVFERVTAENVNRRLAIVLDGVVQSAPVIRERISGGRAQITGRFTINEARDLTIALRSGSLPAPVTILERRTVGPSLGRDSIRAGLTALAVGGTLVLCFMVLYYRTAGLVANMALVLNLILIAGALAAFRATLTLPGIAGIVLTIGMAVDANVLIFERIREELRLGKTPASAVEGGYAKALSTILDANVTTFIAAAVLWQYGTGPIKGFAVTLSIGILASMFTAIIGTRVAFDGMLRRTAARRLSIG